MNTVINIWATLDHRNVPANVSTVIGDRQEQNCVSSPLELHTASRHD